MGHIARTGLVAHDDASDVVVLTSRSEGIPLVLMEAMALGKIVLAPAITGIPELVRAGETGFMYQSGSLQDFVAQLRFIYSQMAGDESAGLLEQIKRNAAHIDQNFNRAKNLQSFADLFLQRTAAATRAGLMRILFCNKYNFPFSGTEMYLFEAHGTAAQPRARGRIVFHGGCREADPTQYDRHFVPHIDFKSKSAWWRRARQVPQCDLFVRRANKNREL